MVEPGEQDHDYKGKEIFLLLMDEMMTKPAMQLTTDHSSKTILSLYDWEYSYNLSGNNLLRIHF